MKSDSDVSQWTLVDAAIIVIGSIIVSPDHRIIRSSFPFISRLALALSLSRRMLLLPRYDTTVCER